MQRCLEITFEPASHVLRVSAGRKGALRAPLRPSRGLFYKSGHFAPLFHPFTHPSRPFLLLPYFPFLFGAVLASPSFSFASKALGW